MNQISLMEPDDKLRTINELLYADHIEIVERGDLLSLIKLELDTGIVSNSYVCQYAAFRGHLEIVKHIHFYGAPLDALITCSASASGNVDLLRFLHENKCRWHSECISNAVWYNSLEAVKYLYSIGLRHKGSKDIIALAINAANIDMIFLLQTKGYKIKNRHFYTAIDIVKEEDSLRVLKYLHTQCSDLRKGHYELAILKNKKKVLEWLYSVGCPREYLYSPYSDIEKFQHDIGDLICGKNCLYCHVNRMKELMRLLCVEEGYGSWLSSSLIRSVTNQLV